MKLPRESSGGTLDVRATNDLVLDAGRCRQSVHPDEGAIVEIDPPPVPMFLQVAEHLEAQPLQPPAFVRWADETRAAAAVCLRWGSYFAVLADESRPFASDVRDETVSQINDDEMARMNVEISAAIAWWLTLKASDKQRYEQLVRRALAHLPLGRKTMTRSSQGDVLKASATVPMAIAVRSAWPAELLAGKLALADVHGVRAMANTITLLAWRNGPVENVHAGRFPGYGFNERRVLPSVEKAIMRQAQNVLHGALVAMEYLAHDAGWPPPPERVLPFLRPFCHPGDWSYTLQSRIVKFFLRPESTA